MADAIQSTFGEVENFYKELLDSKTPKVKKFHVYGVYQNAVEENEKRRKLEKSFETFNSHTRCFATIITEDIVIFTDVIKQDEFYPCLYDNETMEITNYSYNITRDFDEAILIAFANKYYGDVSPVKWIEKLLNKTDGGYN